jgi:hypothetical protein
VSQFYTLENANPSRQRLIWIISITFQLLFLFAFQHFARSLAIFYYSEFVDFFFIPHKSKDYFIPFQYHHIYLSISLEYFHIEIQIFSTATFNVKSKMRKTGAIRIMTFDWIVNFYIRYWMKLLWMLKKIYLLILHQQKWDSCNDIGSCRTEIVIKCVCVVRKFMTFSSFTSSVCWQRIEVIFYWQTRLELQIQ